MPGVLALIVKHVVDCGKEAKQVACIMRLVQQVLQPFMVLEAGRHVLLPLRSLLRYAQDIEAADAGTCGSLTLLDKEFLQLQVSVERAQLKLHKLAEVLAESWFS